MFQVDLKDRLHVLHYKPVTGGTICSKLFYCPIQAVLSILGGGSCMQIVLGTAQCGYSDCGYSDSVYGSSCKNRILCYIHASNTLLT